MSVIDQINQAISQVRRESDDGRSKTSFWASESETMAFEIYHRWKGTTPTNPMDEEKQMMLKMRKLTEEAVVYFLKQAGNVIEKYTNGQRIFFEWGPNKVPISGYSDIGMHLEQGKAIVEVKTYYGGKNHSEIRIGKIKPSYLKQLAIYLYSEKIDHGVLLMINQGTGEMFEFDIWKIPDTKYRYICPDNEIEIDLELVFKRWEKIWLENIQPDKEPEIEYLYKYPIDEIDWENTPASAITKARKNRAVIGDWQVKYSSFKDMIIKKQNTCHGYSDKELKKINELTAGYSARKQNMVRFDPKNI